MTVYLVMRLIWTEDGYRYADLRHIFAREEDARQWINDNDEFWDGSSLYDIDTMVVE